MSAAVIAFVVASHIIGDGQPNPRMVQEDWASLINAYPDRFIYGSDALAPYDRQKYFATLLKLEQSGFLNRLNPSVREQILWGNAERIVGQAVQNITQWRTRNEDLLRSYRNRNDLPSSSPEWRTIQDPPSDTPPDRPSRSLPAEGDVLANLVNSVAFALRGGVISGRGLYSMKAQPAPSADPLDARRPLGKLVRGVTLGTYLANDAVFANLLLSDGLTIDPTKPVAMEVLEKTFAVGFGVGNALLTGTTATEFVGGFARPNLGTGRPTQVARTGGMTLLTAASFPWTAHTGWQALEQYGQGHPGMGTALAAATVLEGLFTAAITKATGNDWARLLGRSINPSDLAKPQILLGAALLAGMGIHIGIGLQQLLDSEDENAFAPPTAPDATGEQPDDTLDPDDFETPPPPRDDEPEPEPLNVVLPVDGLNLRSDASAEADPLGVLLHGTFIQPTGARKYDENGNEWLEVEGQVYGGETMRGWVNASYVAAQIPGEAAQIPGEQGNAGRINPELEAQGYRYVVIGDSDTFWGIASTNDVSFDKIVAFNAHIIDPDQVYAGDRVYLPHTAMPIEQRPR